jgi:hypothetical protein
MAMHCNSIGYLSRLVYYGTGLLLPSFGVGLLKSFCKSAANQIWHRWQLINNDYEY